MKRLPVLALILLSGCSPAARSDLNRILGIWVVTAFETPGSVPERSQIRKRATVYEGTWSQQFQGEQFEDFEYTLNPAASPKEIDLHYTQPDGKRVTVRGIYELNGDQLKLCLGTPPVKRNGDQVERVESVRAAAFEAREGILVTFRRLMK